MHHTSAIRFRPPHRAIATLLVLPKAAWVVKHVARAQSLRERGKQLVA